MHWIQRAQTLVLAVCAVLLLQPTCLCAADGVMGMEGLKRIFDPSKNSNCSGAVDMHLLNTMCITFEQLGKRIDLSPYQNMPVKGPDRVKYINAGAGTTGTTSVFHDMCSYNITGSHWFLKCNQKVLSTTNAKEWRLGISRCFANENRDECLEKSIKNYPKTIYDTLARAGAIFADTPATEMFIDLLAVSDPDVSIIMTYRQPMQWARRRRTGHGRTLICDPSLWDSPGVFHPFDFIGCIMQRPKNPALRWLNDLSVEEVARAYTKMATVLTYFSLRSGRRFLPLCVFDSAAHNPRPLLEQAFPELLNEK